jgi:hypothetical protein
MERATRTIFAFNINLKVRLGGPFFSHTHLCRL